MPGSSFFVDVICIDQFWCGILCCPRLTPLLWVTTRKSYPSRVWIYSTTPWIVPGPYVIFVFVCPEGSWYTTLLELNTTTVSYIPSSRSGVMVTCRSSLWQGRETPGGSWRRQLPLGDGRTSLPPPCHVPWFSHFSSTVGKVYGSTTRLGPSLWGFFRSLKFFRTGQGILFFFLHTLCLRCLFRTQDTMLPFVYKPETEINDRVSRILRTWAVSLLTENIRGF